mmetsp:Transcript_20638/g.26314  ORF Transcript_20638/g.26314 Transcript_20638/m.26314 type:complete len:492 (+) Transcript_20638:87-1562(+)|eukprot:CAMPEP_0204874294 /NCGR_PEP_ID=MMETSP1348-20121228/42696_1 /ASSEMBLY_ACC=CAM_ASM_000700 /TAXON_ID=215587 /ORGANISM="Aplanochytrium stocchinoi, Strain GSBS06" /LENGTH=491 /DNA_ID=CAMNT_0052030019 /DNA_START=23 /DNA_END=1498 /DNA_ORIENTATION=+
MAANILPEDLISWKGVSVAFLLDLKTKLEKFEVGKRTHIYEVVDKSWRENNDFAESQTVNLVEGETIRAIKRAGPRWFGYKKTGEYGWFERNQVREKRRKNWSIEDVYDYILKTQKDVSIVDTLSKEYVSGKPYLGTMCVVSWKMSFVRLVEMIVQHFKGKDLTTQFVWIDMFAANYARAKDDLPGFFSKMRKFVSNGLYEAMCEYDDILVCFENGVEPNGLNDKYSLWCVFMYEQLKRSRADTNVMKPLNIVLPTYEYSCLQEDIMEDFDGVVKRFQNIDIASAWQGKAGEYIDQEMKRGRINVSRLNSLLTSIFIDWLLKVARDTLDKEKQAFKPGWQGRSLGVTFGMCMLYSQLGRQEALEDTYWALVELGKATHLDIPDMKSFLTNTVDDKAFYERLKASANSDVRRQDSLKKHYEQLKAKKKAAEKKQRNQRYGGPRRLRSKGKRPPNPRRSDSRNSSKYSESENSLNNSESENGRNSSSISESEA